MEEDKKKVFIRTFGCQMNDRDSELIMGMLLESGFAKSESVDDAGVILFSTCSVRKHAEDRLFGALHGLKKLKEERPDLVIGVTGCTAQAYKRALFAKFPYIDFICGPSNIYEIPEALEIASAASRPRNDGKIALVDREARPIMDINPPYRQDPEKAYVNIGYGCDNFCSYCIVPYVRGREVSRPRGMILEEVRRLAENGCKEIVLLGQNVNSYRDPGTRSGKASGFPELLRAVNEIEGIERIRFMTSHPKDAGLKLFKAMKDCEKVVKHLHLPLQSGSDRILRLMNRGYTLKKYMSKINALRKAIPGIKISTDIIVGFPTEKENDFSRTKKAMEDIGFDKAFVFKYSPRPPAKSSLMKDDVPEETKRKRNDILLKLQKEIFRSNKGEPVHVG